MRIAFVSTLEHTPWGGSEELWMRTAVRLAERGLDVHANVQSWPQPVPQIGTLQRAGCHVTTRSRPSALGRALRRWWSLSSTGWLRQVKPDLVVISQGGHYDGMQWMQECRSAKVRYVTITQNIADWHWPSDEVLTELANLHAASHANFFVAQGNIDLVAKQLGEPVRNAALVRNPFNVSYDVQLEWPPEDGVYHLACVAQLTPLHKGQDLILEVLRRPQWRSRAIDLTFVGTGPNRKHLAALADSYGLHNVKFAGFQADIPRVWASNHLMILASRCEGTPLAVVEALLCGRPCIVTRVAGNAEVVEEGVSGFIAAAPTADLLDDAMERAWSKRHEWKRMGESASVRIRELVPSDPVELFANELIVSGTRQRH